MTEEDEAFEDLAKRQGDWGMQGSRKHQILRYAESEGSMNNKDTSGPAFPVFPETSGGHAAAFQGMTLRDYFAAKAMLRVSVNTSYEDLAKTAYKIADEMLKARET
jgi:hypothetical protein